MGVYRIRELWVRITVLRMGPSKATEEYGKAKEIDAIKGKAGLRHRCLSLVSKSVSYRRQWVIFFYCETVGCKWVI